MWSVTKNRTWGRVKAVTVEQTGQKNVRKKVKRAAQVEHRKIRVTLRAK